MPLEAVIEWGITLLIFAVLALACVQAVWPDRKNPFPEDYDILEEASAIVEECWRELA